MGGLKQEYLDKIDAIVDKHKDERGPMKLMLHDIQDELGYIPFEAMEKIAEALNVPVSKVYGVVSFYSYFTTEPRGKYKISVCLGTVCFVKGSDKILSEFEKQLGIKAGQTSKDLLFSLDGLRCVGACGLAPVVVVNGKVYGQFKLDQVGELLDYYKSLENTTV